MIRLTPREAEVLTVMLAFRDEADAEIVYERGQGYQGIIRVSPRLVFSLIRKMCVRPLSDQSEIGLVGHIERYTINETGVKTLRAYWGIYE
jgi:hypothetical protein